MITLIKKHISFRHVIQSLFALVVMYIGISFIIFVNQIANDSSTYLSRPAGVEAFLPISALVGLKAWISTGAFDPIHPAGLVILLVATLVSLFLKRTFCSWICPIGTLSEGLAKIGRTVYGRNFRIPKGLDYLLRSLKYIILFFFVTFIFFGMKGEEAAAFVLTPYNMVSDIQMLRFFQHLSILGIAIIGLIALLSIFYENFWCRYLCPYGCLLGLVSLVSPFKVRRNQTACIQCGRCTKSCPNQIPVDQLDRVWSPECTGCLNCVQQCPVKDTLTFKALKMPWSLTPLMVGLALLFIWSLSVIIAKLTGHWETSITTEMYRALMPR